MIVSRHKAAIEFVQLWLSTQPEWCERLCRAGVSVNDIPIFTGNATSSDVAGKVCIGNLPLQLAAQAASVVAIEFSGQPPRGQEYGLTEMQDAGARLVEYVVRTRERVNEVAEQVADQSTWYGGETVRQM